MLSLASCAFFGAPAREAASVLVAVLTRRLLIARSQADDPEGEPRVSLRDKDAQVEQAMLATLVSTEGHRPWSVHEMELEIGEHIAVIDGLRHLQSAGLIHRCHDFVWATRAAIVAEEMAF